MSTLRVDCLKCDGQTDWRRVIFTKWIGSKKQMGFCWHHPPWSMLRLIMKMTHVLRSGCDGYNWLYVLCEFRQNPLKVVYTSFWPFARHTASRCLYFRAILIIICVIKLRQPIRCARIFSCHTYHPSSSYLRVNMGCALWLSVSGPLLQRSHKGRPPFQGSDLGVPNLHYTPN